MYFLSYAHEFHFSRGGGGGLRASESIVFLSNFINFHAFLIFQGGAPNGVGTLIVSFLFGNHCMFAATCQCGMGPGAKCLK